MVVKTSDAGGKGGVRGEVGSFGPPESSIWSEVAFRQVVEYAPTAMVLVDVQGRVVLLNAQAERLFAYRRDELLGKPVECLIPERFVGHEAVRSEFVGNPRPRPMGHAGKLFARRRDGSEFPVDIGLTPIDLGAGPMVLAAIVDITDRHRLEERFRRVVEFSPSAMVMVDQLGTIVLVNAQTEAMFGYPREALIGQYIEVLVPMRLRGEHQGFRNGFFKDPRPRPMGGGRELFACSADGTEFPVEIGLNPIETEDGVMVLASIVDITERRRSQEAMERALAEKTVLLNEVHHRVKNNLQVISSLLNLQAAHAGDPRLQTLLNESQGRVKAMALTHQLLYERKDFSRVDLAEYLNRLIQLLRGVYRASNSGVEISLEVSEGPVYLDLDRAIPCGLLVNELVTNCFKHAFPGDRRGRIIIGMHRDSGELELVVRDDGVGLPAGFDLNAVTSLGLQLVPLFADQLQAELGVGSASGTSFSFRFSDQPKGEGEA